MLTPPTSWDGADRSTAIRTLGPAPAEVGYTRDATDRITRRGVVVGDVVSEVYYGYTGDGDTADFALDGAKKILTRSISLPGGVVHTWKPLRRTGLSTTPQSAVTWH